jgi:four helix bundle protein
MKKENIVYDKAYKFAIRIVRAYEYLTSQSKTKRMYKLADQLLRSGTSIGANLSEANGAISKADFSAKISISYKECQETKFWLSLLKDTGYIDEKTYESISADAEEIGRLLFAILNTTRIKSKT